MILNATLHASEVIIIKQQEKNSTRKSFVFGFDLLLCGGVLYGCLKMEQIECFKTVFSIETT